MILCKLASVLLATCLLPLPIVADKDQTGLRFRVTDKGLGYILNLGEKLINDKLSTTKLPAIRLQIDAGPGKGQATMRKLIISDYKALTFKHELLPPSGIQWGTRDGALTIKGIWAAWYKFLFKISVDGYFIASVQNLSISTILDITKSSDGRPEIKVPNCRALVSSVKIKITGGTLPKVMNFFRGALEQGIENAIKKQLCSQVQNVLVEKANAKIRNLPPKIKIRDGPFLLDYTLSKNPLVTENYFEANLKGSITYDGEASPVVAPKMPETQENDRMMYIWLSDYVPQSFFTSLHDRNIIKYEVSKETVPAKYAKYLRTTCSGSTCVGSFKEELADQYPRTYTALDIQSAKTPTLTFGAQKTEVAVQLKIDMYVEPKSPDNLVMTFLMDMNATILPFFKNNNITGNVTVEHFDIQVSYSKVGNISAFETYIVSNYVKPAIEKLINERLGPGVALPTYDNIELVNPRIVSLDRSLKIETDFEYVPPKPVVKETDEDENV